MSFPLHRYRRLRRSESLRTMVRETSLAPSDFIAPLFVVPGKGVRQPVSSMPGVDRTSAELAGKDAKALADLGVLSVILFGIRTQGRRRHVVTDRKAPPGRKG